MYLQCFSEKAWTCFQKATYFQIHISQYLYLYTVAVSETAKFRGVFRTISYNYDGPLWQE